MFDCKTALLFIIIIIIFLFYLFYGNLAERRIEAEEEVVTFRRQWKDDCKSLERRTKYVSDIFDCFTFSENRDTIRSFLVWDLSLHLTQTGQKSVLSRPALPD